MPSPRRQFAQLVSVFALCLLQGCAVAPVAQDPSPLPDAQHAIVIADISDEPFATIEEFKPMADYLASRLGQYGINRGEVQVAPDLDTMARLMAAGSVDIYFDSPYPAMIISDKSGAEPILRRWKDGIAEYSSVIFARANSGFQSVTDLKGRIIAFEEDFSTSGYFLPLTFLLEANLSATQQFELDSLVPNTEIGFVFSGDDEDTLDWVLTGKVAAGAINNNAFAEIAEDQQAGLVILAETEKTARQVVLIRPGIDPVLANAIKGVLTSMDENPEGQSTLQDFEETAQFDEFPTESALTRMRELYSLVANK